VKQVPDVGLLKVVKLLYVASSPATLSQNQTARRRRGWGPALGGTTPYLLAYKWLGGSDRQLHNYLLKL